MIKETCENYEKEQSDNLKLSAVMTVLGWAGVYNMAIRGYVMPLFSQYGRVLKTHRLARQYLWLLIAPHAVTDFMVRSKYSNHVDVLWAVHASRMNKQILLDPQETIYPKEMRPKRVRYTY